MGIVERGRSLLTWEQAGFSESFLEQLESSGAGDYLSDLAYRNSGIFTVHELEHMTEPLPVGSIGKFSELQRILLEAGVRNLTAVKLKTRVNNVGVMVVP